MHYNKYSNACIYQFHSPTRSFENWNHVTTRRNVWKKLVHLFRLLSDNLNLWKSLSFFNSPIWNKTITSDHYSLPKLLLFSLFTSIYVHCKQRPNIDKTHKRLCTLRIKTLGRLLPIVLYSRWRVFLAYFSDAKLAVPQNTECCELLRAQTKKLCCKNLELNNVSVKFFACRSNLRATLTQY